MPNLISIGEIIKKGWQLYTGNIAKFLYPLGIMLLPNIAMYLIQYFNVQPFGLLTVFLTTISVVISLWIGILLIDLIYRIYTNQPVSQENLYETSFKKIPSYFLVSILVGLITMGGLILLIIPGIIFAVWYSFAGYINIIEKENNKGMAALRRSKELVVGRWWKTFWRSIIPALAVYVILMIVVIGLFYMISQGDLDTTGILFNAIVSIVTIIISPLISAFPIILYVSLKETYKPQEVKPQEAIKS